jgi:hypothetical protein
MLALGRFAADRKDSQQNKRFPASNAQSEERLFLIPKPTKAVNCSTGFVFSDDILAQLQQLMKQQQDI